MQGNQSRQSQERRTDSARREAFDQRDRSKRLGVGVTEPKAGAKLGTTEIPALRMI